MWFTIREGFKNLKINKLLTLSTFGTMFTSLTLLGLFASIAFSFIVAFNTFEQEQSNILIFIESNQTQDTVDNIKNKLEKINGVSKIEYISKEDALNKMKNDVKDTSVYKDIKESNPLPYTYILETKQGYSTNTIYTEIKSMNKSMNNIMEIQYEKDYISNVKDTMQNLKIGLIAMIGLLVVVSLFLIMIVTNLTIYNKSQDLKIMLLTGAPIKFIKGPFLVSGAIIGLLSSILSAITVFLGYNQYVELVQNMVPFFANINLYPNNWIMFSLIIIIGMMLGLFGSIIATNKSIRKLIKR
ncbi:MAG: permease-like cell division protein FtsX [Romboutsia sp.]|nr:permease-like cell division protein FtsX [Romboutsia sp.]